MVTIATPSGDVVDIKLDKGRFSYYDRATDSDESWLTRGNLLVLVGYRNDDMFIPRTYARSIYRHSTALIEGYDTLGNLTIRELRYGEKEKTWKDK